MPGIFLNPSQCCCGESVDAYCCVCFSQPGFILPYAITPIGVADADLIVTLNSAWDGRTTWTLTRDGGLCQWSSSCFQVTTGTTGYYRWRLIDFGVGGPGNILRLQRWNSATCAGSPITSYDFPASSAPTANPFNFTATVGGLTPPGAAGATAVTASQSATEVRCYWTPLITGCFGSIVSGALVELIYSGSTFSSGTTDGTGFPPPIEYTNHEGGTGVTYKVTAPGWNDATGDFKCGVPGIPVTIILSTASGYCCQRFRMLGCLGLQLSEGFEVTVYSSLGGSQLAQGTTNGSGEVALSWHGSCSAYITVTHPSSRFADYGSTHTMTTEETTEITLSAGDGYHCSEFCNAPLPDSLSAIDLNGEWPIEYDGSGPDGAGWYGCGIRSGMEDVVTEISPECDPTVDVADVPYAIFFPAQGSGTSLKNRWGYFNEVGGVRTSATPTCTGGILDLTANVPEGCEGLTSEAEAEAEGNPDSCPEFLIITAFMPETGTDDTYNPGGGDIFITEPA